jgi:hypothetical protein
MQRPATWKVLTLGATMVGLSLIGAGAATAQQSAAADCQSTGPATIHCHTNGSDQIFTAPMPQPDVSVYGPFFWQNPAVGSAMRSR